MSEPEPEWKDPAVYAPCIARRTCPWRHVCVCVCLVSRVAFSWQCGSHMCYLWQLLLRVHVGMCVCLCVCVWFLAWLFLGSVEATCATYGSCCLLTTEAEVGHLGDLLRPPCTVRACCMCHPGELLLPHNGGGGHMKLPRGAAAASVHGSGLLHVLPRGAAVSSQWRRRPHEAT